MAAMYCIDAVIMEQLICECGFGNAQTLTLIFYTSAIPTKKCVLISDLKRIIMSDLGAGRHITIEISMRILPVV